MKTQEFRPTPDDMVGQQPDYPASQADIIIPPDSDLSNYSPANKLKDKIAIITGVDSGIGQAVAIAYAMEGAKVSILFNENEGDAEKTKMLVEERGGECLPIKMDVRDSQSCCDAVQETVEQYGKLNILVNNAAYQMTQKKFGDISEAQFRRTFETNVFGYFYMAQAAVPHLAEGDIIINTGSIVGKVGKGMLLDYASSKGVVHAFTKSLAQTLVERQIGVNCLVPGPVWTPNIPATMPKDKVANYDTDNTMERAGQPEELAPSYVFLAASDSSFITGALLDVTGGLFSNIIIFGDF